MSTAEPMPAERAAQARSDAAANIDAVEMSVAMNAATTIAEPLSQRPN